MPTIPAGWSYPYALTAAGRLLDAQEYVTSRLGLSAGAALVVHHNTYERWAPPGTQARIDTNRSQSGRLGPGFYTSTVPATYYGPYDLEVEIPVSALEGQQFLELPGGTVDWMRSRRIVARAPLPPEVTAVATPGPEWRGEAAATWFVFPRASGDWLNSVVTKAEF